MSCAVGGSEVGLSGYYHADWPADDGNDSSEKEGECGHPGLFSEGTDDDEHDCCEDEADEIFLSEELDSALNGK